MRPLNEVLWTILRFSKEIVSNCHWLWRLAPWEIQHHCQGTTVRTKSAKHLSKEASQDTFSGKVLEIKASSKKDVKNCPPQNASSKSIPCIRKSKPNQRIRRIKFHNGISENCNCISAHSQEHKIRFTARDYRAIINPYMAVLGWTALCSKQFSVFQFRTKKVILIDTNLPYFCRIHHASWSLMFKAASTFSAITSEIFSPRNFSYDCWLLQEADMRNNIIEVH